MAGSCDHLYMSDVACCCTDVVTCTWHGKGDYVATVTREATKSVLIHQLSKRRSQAPFKKSKGDVQSVLFHPTRPFFMVAVRALSDIVNRVCTHVRRHWYPMSDVICWSMEVSGWAACLRREGRGQHGLQREAVFIQFVSNACCSWQWTVYLAVRCILSFAVSRSFRQRVMGDTSCMLPASRPYRRSGTCGYTT